MIDAWFGRLLDALDAAGLWESTAVIVTTDHGHYLGEKDVWGKPQVPVYEPLGHIPLLVAWPGVDRRARPTRSRRASTSTPRCATCSAWRRASRPTASRWSPSSTATATSAREWAVAGVWGREVHLHHRRRHQVRAGARGRQRAAVDVVEPVVDDADAAPRPRAPAYRTTGPCSTACPARRCP